MQQSGFVKAFFLEEAIDELQVRCPLGVTSKQPGSHSRSGVLGEDYVEISGEHVCKAWMRLKDLASHTKNCGKREDTAEKDQQLRQKDQQLRAMSHQVQDLERHLNDTRITLAARNSRVEELRSNLNKEIQVVNDLDARVRELEQQLAERDRQLLEKEKDLARSSVPYRRCTIENMSLLVRMLAPYAEGAQTLHPQTRERIFSNLMSLHRELTTVRCAPLRLSEFLAAVSVAIIIPGMTTNQCMRMSVWHCEIFYKLESCGILPRVP